MEKKYSSEEDKKVEKLYLPNKSNRLKKRSEFVSLRKKCKSSQKNFFEEFEKNKKYEGFIRVPGGSWERSWSDLGSQGY